MNSAISLKGIGEWEKKCIITVILANLKAEMNKLEIIDGMLMESMIESLEWTAEDELEPHAISKTNKSHQSALPNGLIGDLWFAAADAAPRQTANKNKIILFLIADCLLRSVWWIWFLFAALVARAVMGAAAPMLRKEKTNAKRRNQIQIKLS